MRSDSTNFDFFTWLNPNIIFPALAVCIPLFLYWLSKRKMRPTMSNVEFILDEYGPRLLFTIISNNPAGSRTKKLFISKRFCKIFFKNKTRLIYKNNFEFLNPPVGETIPRYLIKGQETFVAILDLSHLTKNNIYKLIFYTSDGCCSKTYSHYLGNLFNRALQNAK